MARLARALTLQRYRRLLVQVGLGVVLSFQRIFPTFSHVLLESLTGPSCWDGVTLDPPDHKSHVAFPASGTYETNGPCPSTHPVKIPQVMYEVLWDTSAFNDPKDWPADGSQPFVYSTGDG